MALYEVQVKQVSIVYYEVVADSPEEARDNYSFDDLVSGGEVIDEAVVTVDLVDADWESGDWDDEPDGSDLDEEW